MSFPAKIFSWNMNNGLPNVVVVVECALEGVVVCYKGAAVV